MLSFLTCIVYRISICMINMKIMKVDSKKENAVVNYVIEKIHENVSGEEIKGQLVAVGWTEYEAEKAYGMALAKCGVPGPSHGNDKIFSKKSTAGEIVVNLFSFVALGFVAVYLGILYYNLIDHFFPDLLAKGYDGLASSRAIHYAIAVILVGFPMYWMAVKFWFSRFEKDAGKFESWLTRWLTYLVLLVVAIVVVGDLVAVVFYFLQGEISVRFFLKALVILVISGGFLGFIFSRDRLFSIRRRWLKHFLSCCGEGRYFLFYWRLVWAFGRRDLRRRKGAGHLMTRGRLI